MNLADILKDSNYKLSQFTAAEIDRLEQTITVKESKSGEVPYVICLARQKAIRLTPEEAIRQLYLYVLTDKLDYPLSRIQVEYGVNFGREVKRADIVVMDKDRPTTVYMLVELKKPKLKDGKDQLRSYCNATGAPIAVWTNGDQISYYQRKDPNYFEDIPDLPNVNQTLADILQIKFTLEDLITHDKLVKENKSLKTLIEEMEDEVLANAGVDVFEELFKLIFTKLYDEWYSGQGTRRNTRSLEFRNTGQTETALKTKIQDLFDKAKQKWAGVFSEGAKITLTPSHLSVCVSSLENVKLFNSNLDVIDEAFEYLINQSSKGDKGQYFTPRYVIDMCVKMLNPQEDEYMLDTAAGSSGFPVHTMFHVWRQIMKDMGLAESHLFTAEPKPPECGDYVREKVFSIDFDEKAVRVARTLNLIAGDGEQNVLHLNTLDFEMWDEIIQQEDWNDTYNTAFSRLKKLRTDKNSYQKFQFDLLMANPPFAGDIKEPRMIARYDLAKKPDGKWQTKVGRDILFIERNLDFLKPGGRMAIVLPQGRFNNSSDKNIRDFIASRCRILAVVGLHGNTFKPHTGTKTSVLFVQKWNDDPKLGALCPRQDDYNIFFATMQKSGKDNSGEKIYRRIVPKDEEGLPEKEKERKFLLDPHDHLIVDHDLYNHEGLTEDGIAEAFVEFAKKEKFSFFEQSLSVTPFDAVRYQQLMDGLEAVELSLSEVISENDVFRIDNDFFQKKFLLIDKKFKNNDRLGDCTKSIVCGPFGSTIQDDTYQETGVIVVRPFNLVDLKVENNNLVYIAEKDIQSKGLKLFKKGALFFSRVGDVKCGILTQNEVTISANIIAAEINSDLYSPYFLDVFFNSKFGKFQILRAVKTVAQPTISTDTVRRLKLPRISKKFQNICEKILLSTFEIETKSQVFYQQAEDLLLSELGLKDWQPTEKSFAIKSFSESFLSSDRLDAEYYQPKFDQLIERLKEKVELIPLRDLLTLNQKGRQPDYIEEDGDSAGCLPVINSKYVRTGEVILSDNRYASFPEYDRPLIIKKNDVLFNGTGVGTVGRCATYFHEQEALPDTEVAVMRSDILDPVYLSIYINSIAGQFQVQKHLQGSSGIIRVYPSDTNQFLIWNAPKAIQQEIRSKVETSHQKREQSKQLLEIAKIGVERAIETDEANATDWIALQLEALGITLTSSPEQEISR